jgi:hypothetical protein
MATKTEPHRPWSALAIQVPDQAQALFSMATSRRLEMEDIHSSGLIGGSKGRPSQTLPLNSMPPSPKQGNESVLCMKLL